MKTSKQIMIAMGLFFSIVALLLMTGIVLPMIVSSTMPLFLIVCLVTLLIIGLSGALGHISQLLINTLKQEIMKDEARIKEKLEIVIKNNPK